MFKMFKGILLISLVGFLLSSCANNPKKDESSVKGKDSAATQEGKAVSHKMSASEYQDIINKALDETRGNVFNFDRYEINPDYFVVVKALSAYMSDYSNIRVVVSGHCDKRGSREYNLALGEKRAESVKNALISQGIDANRISIISYGEERPYSTPSNTEESWAKDRRAEYEFEQ